MKTLLALFLGTVAGLAPLNGQTVPNAVPIPSSAGVQFFDSTGAPLAGGKLFTYLAGTTTPQATYTDNTASVANTNPIILDSLGRAQVWIGPNSYKFVLQDAASVIQWTQDNIVDTVLYFLNFVKTAGTATLISYTPPNLQPQTTVAAELTALTSSPYTNLKLNCGAKGDGSTDDSAAIANCLANHAVVFAPPGTYCTQSQIVVPNKTKLLGAGRGDGGGPNTVFKACNGFPFFTAVISLCSTPGPCFGVEVEHLTIDCNSIAGCIGGLNNFSQEQSWFRHVLVTNAPAYGFLLDGTGTSGNQNSGPDEDLEVLPGTAAVATTVCYRGTLVLAWRGLRGITCNMTGFTAKPTNALVFEGTNPGAISAIHIENATNGIVLGSLTIGTSDFMISEVNTNTVDNAIVLAVPGGGGQDQGITIIGVTAFGTTNLVVDNVNTITITNASAQLGYYITGEGLPNQQNILTSRKDVQNRFFGTSQPTYFYKGIDASGTGASDGGMFFGAGRIFSLKPFDIDATHIAPVLQTGTGSNGGYCFLIQRSDGTAGPAGGGLCLNGQGFSLDPARAQVGAGYTGDTGTLTARATTAASVIYNDGDHEFYSDSGLVAGNVFSPTLRWQMKKNGYFNSVTGFSFNGTNGFTGTKTAGSCVMTIQGGIITNVTGC